MYACMCYICACALCKYLQRRGKNPMVLYYAFSGFISVLHTFSCILWAYFDVDSHFIRNSICHTTKINTFS